MRDLPILFSAPMVHALKGGRKTQTRRILTPQPSACEHGPWPSPSQPKWTVEGNRYHCRTCGNGIGPISRNVYGGLPARFAVGDRLWVREAHYLTDNGDEEYAVFAAELDDVAEHLAAVAKLEKSHPAPVWARHKRLRPSIHLPRWASRLTLIITDVRVQRLQDISRDDAIAEGLRLASSEIEEFFRWPAPFDSGMWLSPPAAYAWLWDQINGAGSWARNPWIVALTFTVNRCNIDAMPVETRRAAE